MKSASDAVLAYLEAWNENDAVKRAELLSQCWAEQVYNFVFTHIFTRSTYVLARGCGRQSVALSLPTFFLLALEAQRRLAGGETTGKPAIIAFAPRQGRQTGA